MDSTEQNHLATTIDPAIAGRVVRNIAEVERDYQLAEGHLSDRVLREIISAMRNVTPPPFEAVTTAWSAIITCPGWKPTKRIGRGDVWLEIVEHAKDDNDHTWLAAALGAGPTELHLQLNFREGLSYYLAKLEADQSLLSKFRKKGFKIDATNKRLYLPIALDAELLAKSFVTEDFTDAMAPAREATELALAAKPEIDQLLQLVRG